MLVGTAAVATETATLVLDREPAGPLVESTIVRWAHLPMQHALTSMVWQEQVAKGDLKSTASTTFKNRATTSAVSSLRIAGEPLSTEAVGETHR